MTKRLFFVLFACFIILDAVLLLIFTKPDILPFKLSSNPTPYVKNDIKPTITSSRQSGFVPENREGLIFLENKSKNYTIDLVNKGKNLKLFLSQNGFFNSNHLYLHEKGQYISAKEKNIRIILVDELQSQTQLMIGDVAKEYFIGSSVGVENTPYEIIFYLHLDSRLKQKYTPDKISLIANSQIAQRAYMMIDYSKVQEAMNQLTIKKTPINFFNVK